MISQMSHKINCLVCGAELKYENDYRRMKCTLCGQEYDANVACVNGHFVCDACHSLPANDFIAWFCIASNSKNPIEQAITLMKDSRVKMHGPEHHFLVPAVLLSAYYNVSGEVDKKEEKINLAQKRAANVLGGFCGFYGDCGAAVGVGIFISVLTGSTPLSTNEWRLSNLGTAYSLLAIAEKGGPRCCKRNSFLAIQEATRFVQEHFKVTLPTSNDIKCDFNHLNKECIKEKCPFYHEKDT
jgi:hypothetical protein